MRYLLVGGYYDAQLRKVEDKPEIITLEHVLEKLNPHRVISLEDTKQVKTCFQFNQLMVRYSNSEERDLQKVHGVTTNYELIHPIEDFHTMILHGSLADYLSTCGDKSLDKKVEPEESELLTEVFDEMESRDLKCIINGAVPEPCLAYKDLEKGQIKVYKGEDTLVGLFNLFGDRMHLINPGSFREECYAVLHIGDDVPKLQFLKLPMLPMINL